MFKRIASKILNNANDLAIGSLTNISLDNRPTISGIARMSLLKWAVLAMQAKKFQEYSKKWETDD